MATVILTTRHQYRYRFALAQTTMRLAALPIMLLALVVAGVCFVLRDALGLAFSTDPAVVSCVASLSWYIAPMLLFKASAGLHGNYLAVTGRGIVGTYILLVVPFGIGLPAAYAWAAATGGGAQALLLVHTGAWLLTACCFAFFHSRIPTISRQLQAAQPPATSSGTRPASAVASLAAPLLKDSAPAR